MSYQIYYDRAYIRVGDQFIPLVNSGSNNCFEVGLSGRYQSEKNWNVMNWKRSGRLLFSDEEIREIAKDYDQYNQECGMMFKSRNRCFAPGEMERWIINGMNRAYSVEEYISFGNSFHVLDYSDYKSFKRYPFKTTAEMLQILELLKDVKSLEIELADNREVYRPKAIRAQRTKLHAGNLTEYYVLKGEYEGKVVYFMKLSRRGGFKFFYEPNGFVKPFLSEKDARRYLQKYYDRLVTAYHFAPELIVKPA